MIDAFKEALAEPKPLPFDVLRLHLTSTFYMGRPVTPPTTGKRGRPVRKTQYDNSRERWLMLLGKVSRRRHQIDVLPRQGRKHAWSGLREYEMTLAQVLYDNRIPASRRVTAVIQRLRWRNPKRRPPSRKTIKADLDRLGGN